MDWRIPVAVIFGLLALSWLALLAIGQAIRRIAAATEALLVTVVLILRRIGEPEDLLDTLDEIKGDCDYASAED